MLEAIISIQKSCIHTSLILASLLLLFLFLFFFFFPSLLSLSPGSLSLETQNIRYFDPPLRPCLAKSNKTHFWVKSLYLLFSPPLSLFLQFNLCYFHFGLSSYKFISFRPLFTNYNFVLKYCTIFGFLNFHVLHLNHETFKLCLQNTLNMSKTTRVYFGALQKQLVDDY